MQTPDLVEYLLAAERPGGGKLLKQGITQITVPFFPPMTTLQFALVPPINVFCDIVYVVNFAKTMIPNAFTGEITHIGVIITPGTLSNLALSEEYVVWAEVTNAHPINYLLTNNTGVFQYFEVLYGSLLVESAEDLGLLRQIIARWGTSITSQETLERIATGIEGLRQ